MIEGRTVIVPDPLARANVVEALAGPGAPSGVASCAVDGAAIVVTFDAERTAPELIDALIALESSFVPECAVAIGDRSTTITFAARALAEPDLDPSRIIETYLP